MTIPKLESIPNPIVINSRSCSQNFPFQTSIQVSWGEGCAYPGNPGVYTQVLIITVEIIMIIINRQSLIIFDVSVGPFLDLVQVCFNLSQNYFEVTFNYLQVSFFRNWIEENAAQSFNFQSPNQSHITEWVGEPDYHPTRIKFPPNSQKTIKDLHFS